MILNVIRDKNTSFNGITVGAEKKDLWLVIKDGDEEGEVEMWFTHSAERADSLYDHDTTGYLKIMVSEVTVHDDALAFCKLKTRVKK